MSAETEPKNMDNPKLTHPFTEATELGKEIQQKHPLPDEPGSHSSNFPSSLRYTEPTDLVLEPSVANFLHETSRRYSDIIVNNSALNNVWWPGSVWIPWGSL